MGDIAGAGIGNSHNEPPPLLLVVKVVSEFTKSTDYWAKRAEYSVLEIPEYGIVDPLKVMVTGVYTAGGVV